MKKFFNILFAFVFFIALLPADSFGLERVVTIGGTKASRPITDFILTSVGRGDTYYVDSNSSGASDTRSCKSPEQACATLDGAIDKTTADQNDIIYVLPGHAESEAVASTSISTVDVDGISIIGLGEGANIPTFTLGIATATFTLSGADCYIKNIKIVSSIADVAVGLTASATSDGSVLDGIVFRDGGAAVELLVSISVAAAANNVTIKNCDFRTTVSGGSNNAILSAAVTDLNVIDNYGYGAYATGVMLTSGVLTRAKITGNTFVNSAAIGIALNGTTSTGVLANNFLGGTTSIAAALTGDNAMWCYENYITGAAAASAIIDPAVDAD